MTASRGADERLMEAFRDRAATSRARCSDEDLDRVWRAVAGDLPADERRDLVERVASDPALAEAWRIAFEVQQAQRGDMPAGAGVSTRSWTPAWIGIAAALIVAVGVGIVQLQRAPANNFRAQAQYAIESTVPADAALSRNAFTLRWTPGPAGTRYQVRVTTEDLQVIATANDVSAPEFVVPAAQLSTVAAGARVFWQVVAVLPQGERISSRTFVTRTQ